MSLANMIAALDGLPLSSIWQGHGSALFLEFGSLSARFRPDGSPARAWGQVSIGLEFDWRIELGDRIVCGSNGNRELWDATFGRMIGATVKHLTFCGIVPELSLALSTGHRINTCALNEDGPAWSLADRRHGGARWLSVKDGQIVEDDGGLHA